MNTMTVNESILPMRNIDNLSHKSKIEKAWSLNNSVMIHEPESTLAATDRVVHILYANNEKADLQSVVRDNCKHLALHEQNKLLIYSLNMRIYLMVH